MDSKLDYVDIFKTFYTFSNDVSSSFGKILSIGYYSLCT